MKKRKSIYWISGVLAGCLVLLSMGFSLERIAASFKFGYENDLLLKVDLPKQNYDKGEVISLGIEVVNSSSKDVSLNGTDVESGYVKIFISDSSLNFKQYVPGGPRTKTKKIVLAAKSTVRSEAGILWNFVPETENLSDLAVKTYSDSQLMTDYAFPNAGIYFVKAVLIIPSVTMTRIESQPVQIIINEPIGNDLKVWDKIMVKGEIGYFIQYNEFRGKIKPEEREKYLNEMEQFVAENPSSPLANQLSKSLETFQLREEKRKGFMDKLKKQQKAEY